MIGIVKIFLNTNIKVYCNVGNIDKTVSINLLFYFTNQNKQL